MEASEATRVTARIKLLLGSVAETTEKIVSLIEVAEAGKAWRALGYDSWTAYVAAEFTGALEGLARAERIPITAKLSTTGMSTRAIANVVGVSVGTAHNDVVVAGVQELNTSQKTIGTDGKTYPRPATFLPSGKPDARTTEALGRQLPPVRPKPRRRPLPDQYKNAVYDLEKAVDRLARLQSDDRFDPGGDSYQYLLPRMSEQLRRLTELVGPHVVALEEIVDE
jgi:hypothetical protein